MMTKKELSKETKKTDVSRRNFLTAAAVTAGAATLGFPAVLKAQGPISMRWQSTCSGLSHALQHRALRESSG
jgi:hypothetical protein